MNNSKKFGRYQQKMRLGIVPSRYDRNSDRFHQGAWKNLDRFEYMRNREALERRINK